MSYVDEVIELVVRKNPAEPEYLFTEVGVGYRMAENPSGE